MLPILITTHVFVTFLLILLVLLQKPKGDAAFAVNSNTSLPKNRFDFITKFTMVLGFLFLLNSILLSLSGMHMQNKDIFADSSTSQDVGENSDSVDVPFEK